MGGSDKPGHDDLGFSAPRGLVITPFGHSEPSQPPLQGIGRLVISSSTKPLASMKAGMLDVT